MTRNVSVAQPVGDKVPRAAASSITWAQRVTWCPQAPGPWEPLDFQAWSFCPRQLSALRPKCPHPVDLVCAMLIISVFYFYTEKYWSTLEELTSRSRSVVKRTFPGPPELACPGATL